MKKKMDEDFEQTSKMMVLRIFDGKEEIGVDDYLDFRNLVQEALWHYEYHNFDENSKGKITTYDFAQSLFVYYFPFHKIDEYMGQ